MPKCPKQIKNSSLFSDEFYPLAERISLDKRDLNESILSKAKIPFVKKLESNVSKTTSENFLLAPALSIKHLL